MTEFRVGEEVLVNNPDNSNMYHRRTIREIRKAESETYYTFDNSQWWVTESELSRFNDSPDIRFCVNEPVVRRCPGDWSSFVIMKVIGINYEDKVPTYFLVYYSNSENVVVTDGSDLVRLLPSWFQK